MAKSGMNPKDLQYLMGYSDIGVTMNTYTHLGLEASQNELSRMRMTIRKMTIEDYDAVYSLWQSCAGMGLNNLDDSKEGIEKFLQRNPDTCFVATKEASIVGVIMVGNDGRRGYIYHTAVHPDYRKQGIAKELVDAALDQLTALGINKVALVVFERNETGNAFWESQGFFAREDLVYRNKALADIVRMDT